MTEFQGIFLSLSAVSIDNTRGGWDGQWGEVGWDGVVWVGWEATKTTVWDTP